MQLIFGLSQEEGSPQPLKAGGCTIHTGRTLHYTGGNLSNHPRRAYIVNFRPKEMIEFERSHDYDHGKKANLYTKNIIPYQGGSISSTFARHFFAHKILLLFLPNSVCLMVIEFDENIAEKFTG
jgi:hypothetical protein